MNPPSHHPTVKVEIWSDFMCPYCYIAKRKFEAALDEFDGRDQVDIVWKSFQLQADLITDPSKNAIEYTAKLKRIPILIARKAYAEISAKAQTVGLNLDFVRAIVANTFDAHRLAHFAVTKGKGDEMQEKLMEAYFVAGINVADHEALCDLAIQVDLQATDVMEVLRSNAFAEAVLRDMDEARQLEIRGVPNYLVNHTIELAGQRGTQEYLAALRTGLEEVIAAAAANHVNAFCDIQGNCS